MAERTAWLIERADQRDPGCVLPDSFLGIHGSYDGLYGSGEFRWMKHAGDAIRFARQKDAAMFIGALSMMQDNMLQRDTTLGFRSGDLRPIVTEHVWTD